MDGGARSGADSATANCRKSCRLCACVWLNLEEALKTARAELDAARDRRGELAAEQARLQSDAQHMAETCIQELSQPREELLADESLAAAVGRGTEQRRDAYRTCARAWRTWGR